VRKTYVRKTRSLREHVQQLLRSDRELRVKLGAANQARMALQGALDATDEAVKPALGAIFAIARSQKGELWQVVGDLAGETLEKL
jgi:hypothetical protein